jgi:putative ABC transport system permease protein
MTTRRRGRVGEREPRSRKERRSNWLGDLMQDLRFGARAAVRVPLFSLLAIVTLAVGIGANAAVFSVVKSVLLDSLPYANAEELVRIYTVWDSSPAERSSVSPGAAADLMERSRSFEEAAVFNFSVFDVAHVTDSGSQLLPGALVTADFFKTLGVSPALGRAFSAEDSSSSVVVLSHAAWQREFGGSPDVIGATLRTAASTPDIIGVLPEGFIGPMGHADLWFLLDLEDDLAEGMAAREQHWLGMIARLASGVALGEAQREIDRIGGELSLEFPDTDRGRGFTLVPLHDDLVGDTRTALLILMASAGLVLLIACANLAGALLSRTIGRRREFAVRVALGAGRGRLIRQLLTESALIAMVGAAAGLYLASVGLAAMGDLAAAALPHHAELRLDAGVFGVTLLAALVTGAAFGLAPALAAARQPPSGALRETSRGASEGRRSRQLRGVLVAGQIALSLTLLAGSGLLVRSLLAIAAAPLGYNPDGVLVARVDLPQSSYEEETRSSFFEEFEERLAALPGVVSVASVSQIPSPTMSSNILTVEGLTLPDDGRIFIPYMNVSDGYFGTMEAPLVAGRGFGPEDHADAPPAIIINETMSRRFWPEGNAVGRRLRVSPHTAEEWGTVIGVVRDLRIDPALPMAQPMAFASYRQDRNWGGRDFLVRTQGESISLIPAVRHELAVLDPALPLRHPRALRAVVDDRLAGRRLPVMLMTGFGALALLLASVGIYAMFATMAAAREREFGVRMALGSSRRAIASLIIRQGAVWMAAGLVVGVAGVAIVSYMLRDLLYGVEPLDPLALGAAAVVLVVSAAIALLGPLLRATRADPVSVMK